MNEKAFLGIVSGLPVFTARQVGSLVGAGYAKVYLHRLAARGSVHRLGRGFYTVHGDPMVWATHVWYPSYISLWHAFSHHGVTTQLPALIEVMAARNGSLRPVEFIRTRELWGYSAVTHGDFRIFMADLEKAVLDAIVTGRVPGDDIVAAIGKCDDGKLERYALKMDVATMKKTGYLAERAGMEMARLRKRILSDRNYVRLAGAKAGNGWRVKDDRNPDGG
jgi:predicted transcriptional regulator of viral defense system